MDTEALQNKVTAKSQSWLLSSFSVVVKFPKTHGTYKNVRQ